MFYEPPTCDQGANLDRMAIMKNHKTACAAVLILSNLCLSQNNAIKVGVYYYPWHGPGIGGHHFRDTLRDHLVPRQEPALGAYSNKDPKVISTHIAQSVMANIDFWACSWWGPDSFVDQALREHILSHPMADRLKYAVLYESTGRMGSFDAPNYTRLQSDFTYLKKHYFNHPSYLRINNRPVVFIYLTRVYFRNRGAQALADLRAAFPDVYLVGDDVFGKNYKSSYAAQWDAVTAYDVYGQTLGRFGSTIRALNELEVILRNARNEANRRGVGLIPFACPGFNDRGVRSGHSGAPRYLTDVVGSEEGDLFRAMLRDVVVPQVDPLAEKMLMITSFNEWHEDTQIEPTRGTAGVTNQDDSDTGYHYTEADDYADYGTLYLRILHDETCHLPEDQCPGTPPAPTHRWKLDETSGSTAHPSKGTFAGELHNMQTSDWTEGVCHGALNFDGQDDFVQMKGFTGINGSHARTISLWVKLKPLCERKTRACTLDGTLLSYGDSQKAGQLFQLMVRSGGKFQVDVGQSRTIAQTHLREYQWYHIAVVLPEVEHPQTGDLQIYVNGHPATLATVNPEQRIDTGSNESLALGALKQATETVDHLKCVLDDIRLYDVALDPVEIYHLASDMVCE